MCIEVAWTVNYLFKLVTGGDNIQNEMELHQNNNNDRFFYECIARAIANIGLLKDHKDFATQMYAR